MGRKKGLWAGLLIFLLLSAGGGYAYYTYVYRAADTAPEPTITSSRALLGDLVLSVSGTGTLAPAAEAELGFATQGYLTELLVQVGDVVRQGDVLARLDTQDLETALLEADVRLRLAHLSLEEIMAEPDATEIADAEAAVQSARNSLQIAQLDYSSSQNSTADAEVRARQIQFQYDVEQFYAAENGSDGSAKSQAQVAEAWAAWSSSEADLNAAIHEAEMEQLQAWHSVEQAQNRLAQAEASLELLYTGPTADTVLRAELELSRAELALEDAQASLDAAELRASFDGTIVAVNATVGERVGGSPILTLADIGHRLLEFWVEEQDLPSVVPGNRLEIIFDALPDVVFSGEVIRVDPTLVTVDQTLAVHAWATVNVADYPGRLLSGMNAEVEVVSAESRNTVLIPLQALRELAPGSYAVFVIGSDGELELRPVQVGLTDFANAVILSGLEAGTLVSLGVAEASGQVALPTQEMMGMPGGIGGMLEGGGRLPGGGGAPPGPQR